MAKKKVASDLEPKKMLLRSNGVECNGKKKNANKIEK